MWLLLPVKAFDAAKKRLSGLLTADERSRLAQAMAADVLRTVAGHPAFSRVVVCSSDKRARELAQAHRAAFLPEPDFEGAGLDRAVDHAARSLLALGAADLAVIHCDLPLLTRAEIGRFADTHLRGGARAITITPDQRRQGSNLLAWRPLAEFSARYGQDSFRRHCELARSLDITINICELPGGGLDIDDPDDLRAFVTDPRSDLAPETRRCLHECGLIERILLSHPARGPERGARERTPAALSPT